MALRATLEDTGGDTALIGTTNQALRVELYCQDGDALAQARNADLDDQEGIPAMGSFLPGRKARFLRLDSLGTMRGGDTVIRFHDPIELNMTTTTGNLWSQTIATATAAVASGVRTYNSGSSVTSAQGAMDVSLQRFERRSSRVNRWRQRAMMKWGTVAGAGTNGVIDMGFGAPAAVATLAVTDGVFFRVTAAGALTIVYALSAAETTLETLGIFSSGVITSDGSVTGFTNGKSIRVDSYYNWEITLGDDYAFCQIMDPETGDVIYERTFFVARTAIGFIQGSHVAIFNRVFNSGTATTACQLLVSTPGVMVEQMDANLGMTNEDFLAGIQRGSNAVPTTQVQAATWANSAATAAATLSNTAAGYATLGGLFRFVVVAGAATDYALFGFTVPSPYRFRCRRIKIDTYNTVVASATTPTVLLWGVSHNAATINLSTGTQWREPIGIQSVPVGTAVGGMADRTCEWVGNKITEAGRLFIVILRMPVGTATATQELAGTVFVEGQFE